MKEIYINIIIIISKYNYNYINKLEQYIFIALNSEFYFKILRKSYVMGQLSILE